MSRLARRRRDAGPTGDRRRRREQGSTVIEAAFAIPILLTIMMGLIDLGVGVLQTSQVSGAAADGARAAIIWKTGSKPDVVGSAAHGRVREAVAGRLMGKDFTFDVRCVTPSDAVVACASADPDRDLLRVTVRSEFLPVSPLGHNIADGKMLSSSATMALIRQPENVASTPSTPPEAAPPVDQPPDPDADPAPGCLVTGVDANPASIDLNDNSGKVKLPVVFTVQTNGGCGSVTLEIGGNKISTGQNGSQYTGTLAKNSRLRSGNQYLNVLVNGIVVATYTVPTH